MKKILYIIAFALFIHAASVFAETIPTSVKDAINEYQKGNYVGCSSSLWWNAGMSQGYNNIYANYYYGLSLLKLGNPSEAKVYFEKVLSQNPKGNLKLYAENAKYNAELCNANLDACKSGTLKFKQVEQYKPQVAKTTASKKTVVANKSSKPAKPVVKNELDSFIGNNHAQYYKNVQKEIEQKQLEVLKYEINSGNPVNDYTFQRYKNYNNNNNNKSQLNDASKLSAENINKMLDAKNIEIENNYNKLSGNITQNKNNVRNR